jgi:hypothetical protein
VGRIIKSLLTIEGWERRKEDRETINKEMKMTPSTTWWFLDVQ